MKIYKVLIILTCLYLNVSNLYSQNIDKELERNIITNIIKEKSKRMSFKDSIFTGQNRWLKRTFIVSIENDTLIQDFKSYKKDGSLQSHDISLLPLKDINSVDYLGWSNELELVTIKNSIKKFHITGWQPHIPMNHNSLSIIFKKIDNHPEEDAFYGKELIIAFMKLICLNKS